MLQDQIEGVADYSSQIFSRGNIAEDLGFKVLMPWTGKGYGNNELQEKFAQEILALQRIGEVLRNLVKKNPYIELGYMATNSNVMVLNNEGAVRVIEAETGYIPNKRPWYIEAKAAGKTIWTQPYVDVNTKKLVVTCATPVFQSNGRIIGVVGFDILLDTLQKDIITIDIGYKGYAFLIDRKGGFLVKPGMNAQNVSWNQSFQTDNALTTDNVQFKAIIEKMMDGKHGLGAYSERGNTSIVSYTPLPAINAGLAIVVNQESVMQPAVDIQKLIFGIWIVVVAISIFIGLLIGNTITSPINRLTLIADQISQGKTDLKEISTTRKDEIGVLIKAFNRLVSSVRIAMLRIKK